MKRILMSTVAVVMLSAAGASAGTDEDVARISAKYEAQFSALEQEGQQLASEVPDYNGFEATVGVSGTVDWEMTSIIFDMPEVSMNTKSFALHLPQFRMKRTSIKWDNPEIHMEMKTIGKYPCFRGLKWYSCDIKTKMPQVRMVRREAKFDIPEVYWDRTNFSLDIPEFRMKRVEIKLHLPQFTVDDVHAEMSEYQARADELGARADKLGGEQVAEVNKAVADGLNGQKTEVAQQFDAAIAQLEKAVSDVRKAGADPAAIQSEAGVVNLLAQLSELQTKKAEAIQLIDSKIEELTAA